MGPIDVRPVDYDSWTDLVALFEARGSPHHCWWCTHFRVVGRPDLSKPQKKATLQRLVSGGHPIGVLADVADWNDRASCRV